MKALQHVYQSILYMEANLKNPITMSEAADAAGYSLYHFSRIFNQATGHSPYDYVIRRRLSEAAQELINTNKKIIELALDYQFNNPETFTRAFHKMFGILPSKLKSTNDCSDLIYLTPPSYDYLHHLKQNPIALPKIIKKDLLCFLGLVFYGETPGPKSALYQKLKNEIKKEKIKTANNYYSLLFNPTARHRQNNGMIAVEINLNAETPGLLIMKKVLSTRYFIFPYHGQLDNINYTLSYLYQTWFPKSGFKPRSDLALIYHGNDEQKLMKVFIPINAQS